MDQDIWMYYVGQSCHCVSLKRIQDCVDFCKNVKSFKWIILVLFWVQNTHTHSFNELCVCSGPSLYRFPCQPAKFVLSYLQHNCDIVKQWLTYFPLPPPQPFDPSCRNGSQTYSTLWNLFCLHDAVKRRADVKIVCLFALLCSALTNVAWMFFLGTTSAHMIYYRF